MGKKKGPPYLNDPQATFIVIDHPWGQTEKRNSQAFVNNVGAWVRFIPRQAGNHNGDHDHDILVEKIYTRKTEDVIIVELPEDTPLAPYLGEHRWSEILKPHARGPRPNINVSLIFEYNYRINGDPANHSWTEQYPTSELPPPQFPIQLPYPPPRYAVRPLNLTTTLAKPMSQPVPIEPPPPLLPPSPSPPPPPPRVKIEEGIIKQEEEDVKPFIKTEDTSEDYQPSAELLAELSKLPSNYMASGKDQGITVKAEPVDSEYSHVVSLDYQPRGQLPRLVTAYHADRGMTTGGSKPSVDGSRGPRKRAADGSRSPRVKLEEEDHRQLKRIRVKVESDSD